MRIADRSTDSLPDDIESLKRLLMLEREASRRALEEAQSTIARHVKALQSKDEEALHLRTWIEKRKLQIVRLRRLKFGRSSERGAEIDDQIEQLELVLEELQASEAQLPPSANPAKADTPSKREQARKPLPDHLPRETREFAPSSHCPKCAGPMRRIGEDVTEILEFVPEHFKVNREVRPKLACRCCEQIVQLPAPSRPIERGLAGPGLLAHVMVSKFLDHLPLYCQSAINARQGVELDRATLADWIGNCDRLLKPLVDVAAKYVLAAPHTLHADDTPVPVLQPGRGSTKEGRFWVYLRDDGA